MAKIRSERYGSPSTSRANSGEAKAAQAEARRRLAAAGLRPTRSRLHLLGLLMGAGERHFTPDDLRAEARAAGLGLSPATIYNSLNRFAEAGLLKRIAVGSRKVFFDTNTHHHHHVYYEERGELRSVPARRDGLVDLPDDLAEIEPERLDIVVRVRPAQAEETSGDER